MDAQQQLDAMRAELEAMRTELDGLRAQVGAATDRIKLTMRGQTRCPGCGATSIVHLSKVLGGSNHGGSMVIRMDGKWAPKRKGPIEAYVCRACGLMEWYTDLADIDLEGDDIRVIEGAAPDVSGGPMR
jgi:hypothetical protein